MFFLQALYNTAMETSLHKNPIVVAAGVLGIGLLLATLMGAYTLLTIRGFDNAISVTGSTKTRVTADSVKWYSYITRTVYESNLQSGYAQIAKDSTAVMNFLKTQGVVEANITVSPVSADQVYNYNSNSSGPREYTLRQTFTVSSMDPADVQKITNLAKNTQAITNQGIFFSTNQPEYYYSKLADLRVSLLADAIKDAKARATELAESSGGRIGSLKAASTGVVQVLAPNSVEVSDYGQYDTSSIEKDVMVTVRATFVVR